MLTRRHFLTLASRGVGFAIVSHGLMGCASTQSSDSNQTSVPVPVKFEHGVASGDPTQDAVILWTRVSPVDRSFNKKLSVAWEVSTDKDFQQLVTNGETLIGSETDYTVKIDAVGLTAGTTYYYRFTSGNAQSDIGKTKTLPSGSVESVKLAVFSCSNFPAGFFNVYDLATKESNLDAVLHLGDYIYEYGRDGYATENAARLGREVLPAGETITLTDYRTRYAQYRSDESLQKLHQQAPFICVWDDHEICNDTYLGGAQNHSEDEGSFEERKLAALQAYFEWMPIRPIVEDNNEIINRAFSFGDMVDLYMLDTRVVGRDKQLEYSDYTDEATGSFDGDRFKQDVSAVDRTLLGLEQLNWLKSSLKSSEGTWQVLGQQVLMGRMLFPAAIVTQKLSTPEYAELSQLALLGQKVKANDPDLKPAEIEFFKANNARLTDEVIQLLQLPNIPYNLDAWDGYAAEREAILGAAKYFKKNMVVLAGDTHNAWANDIKDYKGDTVAVEFATPGVSSPGLESYLNLSKDDIQPTEAGIVQLIEGLQYMNASDRGFLTVTFTRDKVTPHWHFVDTILSRSYSELTARAQIAESKVGEPGIKLV
ncbi:alkaline phosphatase [Alteromonadaceae bacterium M269]|nr:alkaline phosphatase [Alteromonadaceae bacterium M269]